MKNLTLLFSRGSHTDIERPGPTGTHTPSLMNQTRLLLVTAMNNLRSS
jgi:hypothetical protein